MNRLALLSLLFAPATWSQEPVADPASAVRSEPAPEVRWEPFEGRYRTRTGYEPLPGRLGRITVPMNRSRPEGPTIELAFVLFESENPEPCPPILYLMGGPGGEGSEYGASVAMHPLLPLLELGDVIALDQRGVGLSRPNLAAGPDLSYGLPLDRPLTRDAQAAAFEEAVARGREHWEREGVDLASFNTRESAEDVEDLRRALGLDQVVLFGSSYGSHLGLAVLRQHPESVARAVLQKVEGLDHTFKLPGTVQRHLEALAAEVAADPVLGERMPDLVGDVRALLERLEDEPATCTAEGPSGPVELVLGPFDVQLALSRALGQTRDLAGIPALVDALGRGDWSGLAGPALEERSGEVWSMMAVAMDCASGASSERLERIRREALDPANLLGDAINAPLHPGGCEPSGAAELGAAFRAPFACDVPVLFVSGSRDVRTPPENVAELAGGFARYLHLIAEGTGHDSLELMSEDYRQLVTAFLRGDEQLLASLAAGPRERRIVLASGFRFDPLAE